MNIQLIRSATMRINYAGHTILTDPYFATKFSLRSYTGISLNPLVNLPLPVEKIIHNIDAIIISHLHSDHFDSTAKELLPKNLPIFCQPEDAAKIIDLDFIKVMPVTDSLIWENIKLTRIAGKHGTGKVLQEMGTASGFILQSADEPAVYWTGDTLLTKNIKNAIKKFQPKIIITHSSGAIWGDKVKILMNSEETINVCKLAPQSIVVAIHLNSLDHGTVTRETLQKTAEKYGIAASQLLIPQDGEKIIFADQVEKC
jgi:L-ascorbate metabolism protein UlaG (beta-lactamase superfamily)